MEGKDKRKQLGSKKTRSKLSLKRKLPIASDKDDSDSSVGDHRSTSFEFIKAITGETELDQSDDFQDVKKTAKKIVDSKLLKKALKVKPKQKPSAASASVDNKELGSQGEQDGNSSVPENNSDGNSQSVAAESDDAPVTSCTVMLSKLTPLASKTVEIARDKPSTSKTTSKAGDESSSSGGCSQRCPVCQKVLADISGSQQMDQHVNLCLKRHFSAAGDEASEDEHFARQLQEREQEKIMEEKLTDDGFYPCQFCHKDLSKMNSTRRLQHVNRCLDVYEKDVKEQEKIQKHAAQRLIPDCPICGAPLNTKLQRDSHLKRCAREFNISSAQLIEVVRKQEEEFAKNTPVEKQQSDTDDAQSRTTSEAPTPAPKPAPAPKTRGRPKKKKKEDALTNVDEATQLAMAMSASIAPQGTEKNAPDGNGKAAVAKKGKGRKKKNAEKEVPVLLVRSEAERQRMLEHRLANLVAPQDDHQEDLARTPSLRRSKVAEKRRSAQGGSKKQGPPLLEKESPLLWELSAQNNPEQVSSSPFYVAQLKGTVDPGQRRRKSKRGQTPKKKDAGVNDAGSSQVITSTLQVLMDLEKEGAYATQLEENEAQTSQSIDGRKASSSQSPVSDHERVVLDQLSNLVDNETLSDFKIRTSDDNVVHCHQFLLALRCPKLMEELSGQSSNGSCTLNVPKKVLMSVMKYVYCGSVEVEGDQALSIVQFAQKYNLPGLAVACQKILKIRTTPHKGKPTPRKASQKETDGFDGDDEGDEDVGEKEDDDDGGNDEDYDDDDGSEFKKDITELIQSLWSDSEDGAKSSSQDSGPCDNDINEEEMEEIYEFASTQAKQVKQAKPGASKGMGMQESSVDLGSRVALKSSNVEMEGDEGTSDPSANSISPVQKSRARRAANATSSQVPAATGRYTRRGWKPISPSKKPQETTATASKEASMKGQEKPGASAASQVAQSTPLSTSGMVIDDYDNERDVEMEDVSEDVESRPSLRSTRLSSRKLSDAGRSQTKADNVVDLTQDALGTPTPVLTRSSSQSKPSPQKSEESSRKASSGRTVASQKEQRSPATRTRSSSIMADERLNNDAKNDETDNGSSRDVLSKKVEDEEEEDEDESDTSWIIPNTPPVKSKKQNSFAPPRRQGSHSRPSEGAGGPSTLMASTPLDARNRMSTMFGKTFLPKISPVKVVLEKMAFDASNSPVIQDKKSRDFADGKEVGKAKKSDNRAASPKPKKLTPQQNVNGNDMDVSRPLTRQRSLSELSAGSASPTSSPVTRQRSSSELSSLSSGSRSTRSSSQSPARQVASKKGTGRNAMNKRTRGRPSNLAAPMKQNGTSQMSSHQRNITGGKNGALPKSSQSPPKNAKDISDSTITVRRTRRNSLRVGSDQEAQIAADQGFSPAGTPDAPEVLTPDAPDILTPDASSPVVLSDDSPSPTPSPIFGVTPAMPEASPSKEDTGKPSKRKRKQSTPMRSPDRLQLTSNDAAVKVTTPSKLKVDAKMKQKAKLPYKSPAIRKYPSTYHPLKKKYKSFSPLVGQKRPAVRMRTRSVSKTSVSGGNSGDANNISRSDERTTDRSGNHGNSDNNEVLTDDELTSNGMNTDNAAEDAACQGDTENHDNNDDVSVVASSSTENVENQINSNGSPKFEDNAMFAFDLDDGGFDDGFQPHDNSHHGDQQNVYSEKENDSRNSTAKVNFSLAVDNLLTKSNVEHSYSSPTSKVKSPHKNDSGIMNNNLNETTKVQASSVIGAVDGNGVAGFRSSPEVRTSNGNRELWRDFTVSPRKFLTSSNIASTPVISEKVVVVQNYAPSLFGSQDNGELMNLTAASIVPSHRQATASPTLIDHPLSPSSISSVGSPVETAGYYGVGSESFLQVHEEVIDTGPTREAFAVVNEEQVDDEGAFVPPACSVSPQVAIVRPTPIRPNVDELYHPPAAITPMPNYDDMNTPAWRKETYKYGLKPLAKKKARLKLKEIYQYTHQVLETSVDNEDGPDNEPEKQPTKKTNDKQTTKPATKRTKTGGKGQGSSSGAPPPPLGGSSGDGSRGAKRKAKLPVPAAKHKEVTGGESSGDTSDAPSYNDCPEDSILDDDDIPMSQPLSKNPEEAVLSYFKGKKELYHKILMYEPLFIKEFQKELKEAGVVCSIVQLKLILDKQCITFRAEQAGTNRHVRKPKKKKTKTN